jgi:DNA-binding MltR family transcriptional regulator
MQKKTVGKIRRSDLLAFIDFYNNLKSESDRAAVILGTSKIELLLLQIIQKHLLPCPASKDDIFEGEGPLSTFSSRINLAYRLGLIDATLSHSLHIIRKIRNDFAHETSAGNLDKVPHRDRVNTLTAQFVKTEVYQEFKKIILKKPTSSTKDSFRVIISLFVLVLELILYAINQSKNKPFDLMKFINRKPASIEETSAGANSVVQ